jgi:hypothetical protein
MIEEFIIITVTTLLVQCTKKGVYGKIHTFSRLQKLADLCIFWSIIREGCVLSYTQILWFLFFAPHKTQRNGCGFKTRQKCVFFRTQVLFMCSRGSGKSRTLSGDGVFKMVSFVMLSYRTQRMIFAV